MDTIRKAIDSTPTKKVWEQIKENIGKAVYSQKKEFRKIAKKSGSKPGGEIFVLFLTDFHPSSSEPTYVV